MWSTVFFCLSLVRVRQGTRPGHAHHKRYHGAVQAPYLRALPVSLSLPLARLLTAGTAFAPGSLTFTPCPPPPRRQVGNAVQDTAEPAEGPGKGPTSSNAWKAPLEGEASVHMFSKVINTVDNSSFFTPNSSCNLKSYSLETASLVLLLEGSLSLAAQHRRSTRLRAATRHVPQRPSRSAMCLERTLQEEHQQCWHLGG